MAVREIRCNYSAFGKLWDGLEIAYFETGSVPCEPHDTLHIRELNLDSDKPTGRGVICSVVRVSPRDIPIRKHGNYVCLTLTKEKVKYTEIET